MFKYLPLLKKPRSLYRKVLHRVLKDEQKKKLLSFPDEQTIVDDINKISSSSKNNTLFVFPAPSCPWGYMFQRPQQLARAITRYGYHVIYMVDTSFSEMPDWGVRGIKEIEKGIFLYNDTRNGETLYKHTKAKKLVIWQYWPHQATTLTLLKQSATRVKIYDCIDHLDTFNAYPSMQTDFISSLQKADIVLASANNIRSEVSKIRSDCLLVPNGVNTDDFNSMKNNQAQHSQINSKSGIVIGYYGAIAEWFDFDLVDWLADQNPTWKFVIVGEVYPEVRAMAQKLKDRANIILQPRVPYSEIPGLLVQFDVAMIPFIINDITINTSPVKVYEYMAGGKQTVSSDLPEIRGVTGVHIAQNHKEFHLALNNAIATKDDYKLKKQLFSAAEEHSWTKRIQQIMHRIETEADIV